MTTTTRPDRYIAYWLDATSEPNDPRWIVSEERDGGSDTIYVLDADSTRYHAEQIAQKVARRRGLDAFED